MFALGIQVFFINIYSPETSITYRSSFWPLKCYFLLHCRRSSLITMLLCFIMSQMMQKHYKMFQTKICDHWNYLLNKLCNFLNLRHTSYLNKNTFFFNFVNTNLHCFLNANCFMTDTSTTHFSMSEFASNSCTDLRIFTGERKN